MTEQDLKDMVLEAYDFPNIGVHPYISAVRRYRMLTGCEGYMEAAYYVRGLLDERNNLKTC